MIHLGVDMLSRHAELGQGLAIDKAIQEPARSASLADAPPMRLEDDRRMHIGHPDRVDPPSVPSPIAESHRRPRYLTRWPAGYARRLDALAESLRGPFVEQKAYQEARAAILGRPERQPIARPQSAWSRLLSEIREP